VPPEATARQIQDSAEAWLRQQCVRTVEMRVEQFESRQLVLTTRCLKIQLSFAARSPWIAAEAGDTLRCNWRLIELAPEVIDQHLQKALSQLALQAQASATDDLFGTLPA
jgi:predicted metal-dependent hydrolase